MVKKKPKIEISFEEAVEQLKTTTEEAEIKIQEINVNHQIDLDKEE